MSHRAEAGRFTERTPRVVAARKLHRRAERTATGRFLVEGAQAVREAIAAGVVHELFVTHAAADRHADLVAAAGAVAGTWAGSGAGTGAGAVAGIEVSPITERAAAALADTVTTQGVFAVCRTVAVGLDAALAGAPRLVALLAGVADPGNAGTVIRVADAAGADAVVLAGPAVDPHNGKCVRASAGSLFHLPVAVHPSVLEAVDAARAAGLRVLAATAHATTDLDAAADAGVLAAPTAWLFGSEAHGLDRDVLAAADDAVRVPIHGAAESLNLATAAAVCLYASASAQRRGSSCGSGREPGREPGGVVRHAAPAAVASSAGNQDE